VAVHAARALLNLPYHLARIRVTARGDSIEYHSRRYAAGDAAFSATYAPAGQPFLATVGSLEWFLTERYCLYRRPQASAVPSRHPSCTVSAAAGDRHLRRNTMAAVNGLTLPDSAPLLHFVTRRDMVAWLPTDV
jgi:uncharacterized protein YqjF (DUF2071 family)